MRAVPGSRVAGVVGRHGDGWKIRVTSAPEKGKANQELCAVIASVVGVPMASVTVTAGASGRSKHVLVLGLLPEELDRRLQAAIM